jgi:hypothetical protein
MDVSIIIRFRNEAEHLESTLRAVCSQRFSGSFEILAVDNESSDSSPEIARRYADRTLPLNTYRPGRALNLAIEQASGDYIAVLSAHTIPSDSLWLETLFQHMEEPGLAGVYGGQLYNLHSRFLDKRDLDIFSTLEPRIERIDSDFWNANSMFPRAIWKEQHFDETVFELEDHYWTKQLTTHGYHVHFEPRALVYHYGHIERLDREFLPPSTLSPSERIDVAIAELKKTSKMEDALAYWPQVMCAGLELSSLTRLPKIKRAIPVLSHYLLNHPDFDVRWRMAQALGKIRSPESVMPLISALTDPSFYPRDEAAWSLARLGTLATGEVAKAVHTLPLEAISFAALAMGRSGDPKGEHQALQILESELTQHDPQRRCDAAYTVGEVINKPIGTTLIPYITPMLNQDESLQRVACWALGRVTKHSLDETYWPRLRALSAYSPNHLVRFEATAALGSLLPDNKAFDALLHATSDPMGRIRYAAVQSFRLWAEKGGYLPPLPTLKKDSDFGVRHEFVRLKQITCSEV